MDLTLWTIIGLFLDILLVLTALVKDAFDRMKILKHEQDLEQHIYRRNIWKFLFVITPLMTQTDQMSEKTVYKLINEHFCDLKDSVLKKRRQKRSKNIIGRDRKKNTDENFF